MRRLATLVTMVMGLALLITAPAAGANVKEELHEGLIGWDCVDLIPFGTFTDVDGFVNVQFAGDRIQVQVVGKGLPPDTEFAAVVVQDGCSATGGTFTTNGRGNGTAKIRADLIPGGPGVLVTVGGGGLFWAIDAPVPEPS